MTPYDIGAYETEGLSTNPGWTIVPGFKNLGGQVDLISPAATMDLGVR